MTTRATRPTSRKSARTLTSGGKGEVGDPHVMDRADVITLMVGVAESERMTFATIYKPDPDDERWTFGAHVGAVRIRGSYYIRTAADGIEADNLGDLETF